MTSLRPNDPPTLILAVVVYLSITKADRIERSSVRQANAAAEKPSHGALLHGRELATETEGT
jgi:hypothetical protein